jgi:glutamine synthetase
MKAIDMDEDLGYQKSTLKSVVKNINAVKEGLDKMHKALEKAHEADGVREEANILCNKVKPQMEAIREAVDELEGVVDDQYWPLVKYRELLFLR